jgi:hypothetical protein
MAASMPQMYGPHLGVGAVVASVVVGVTRCASEPVGLRAFGLRLDAY